MTFAFIFDSVSGSEWLVLLGVILIVVGPKNLPSAVRKFGQITAQLRRAADEFKRQLLSMDEEIRSTVNDAMKMEDEPEKKPETASSGDTPASSETAAAADNPNPDPSDNGDSAYGASDYDPSVYDPSNPYPGHSFYDETRYENMTASEETKETEETTGTAARVAETPAVPKKPDHYAATITVSSRAGGSSTVKTQLKKEETA